MELQYLILHPIPGLSCGQPCAYPETSLLSFCIDIFSVPTDHRTGKTVIIYTPLRKKGLDPDDYLILFFCSSSAEYKKRGGEWGNGGFSRLDVLTFQNWNEIFFLIKLKFGRKERQGRVKQRNQKTLGTKKILYTKEPEWGNLLILKWKWQLTVGLERR